MTATWPEDIPQSVLSDGFSEEPERNVVTFAPEAGPPKERRRTSISTDLVSYPALLTFDQWQTLKAWWRDDLMDGVLPFTRTDPLTAETKTFKFIDPPRPTSVMGMYVRIDVRLRRLP
jgi:hypothetical protein